jgi:leucyl aminopeptidase
MISYFKSCNNINKKFDIFIFILCNDYKKNINIIQKILNINKIPKKMFDSIDIKSNFEKRLYTDNFEIIFYGIEKDKKCSNESLYENFGKIGKSIYEEYKNKKIFIELVGDDKNSIRNQIISFILGNYKFIDFKTIKKEKNVNEIYFYTKNKKYNSLIEKSIYEAQVQNEIRNLINSPANILNSKKYLSYIKKNIPNDIKIKVLDEKKLKKIGCNLILGVNQGSNNKPMMIILEYNKDKIKNTKPIVLIGKGVMFDSGGYNIKGGNFSDMKNDMTGSAIIYGIFKLLSKFIVNGHYIGLLPIVENMIDSKSIRPGDILKSYSGKTVEVVDTDAEGRLILADALGYSNIYNPYLCIDIATLTGQVSTIFDNKSSVVIGNNNKFIQKIINAGKENNEKFWELPMWKEYVELTYSNIADLKNYTVEAKASTIMAGAFLYNFIPKDSYWLHLDIAGTDNLSHNTSMRHYGATGETIRTLFYFLENINKESYEK